MGLTPLRRAISFAGKACAARTGQPRQRAHGRKAPSGRAARDNRDRDHRRQLRGDTRGKLRERRACRRRDERRRRSSEERGDRGKPEKAEEPVAEEAEEAPEYTTAQENAIASAENYLDFSAFSKKGLIEQLSSEYGDGFKKADAIFAVNHIDVNWNKQAAKAAKNYLETMPFSRSGLIEQLESEFGDGYTHAQAVYGVNQTGL